MSKIYDALKAAYGKKLAGANELNEGPATSLPRPLPGNGPVSIPRFHAESELRALAQNIAALLKNPGPRVIQFIGSKKGEGTSTLIREFALTAAQPNSQPVLLVEADIHQPSQAQAFAREAQPPLDYVHKEGMPFDGVVSKIDKTNLFLATLSTEIFRQLANREISHSTDMWKAVRNQFSLTLIDSAPVHVSPASLALCGLVDGVILVVAEGKTRSAVAKNLKEQILMQKGNLLGIVYTKSRSHIPEFLHKFF